MQPALKQANALSDGTEVNQVDCLVQLKHQPAWLRAHLAGGLTVETVHPPPVGVFPFRFPPPNVRATVKDYDARLVIVQLLCLQLSIKDRDLHQEGTPVTHHHWTKASLRPKANVRNQNKVTEYSNLEK